MATVDLVVATVATLPTPSLDGRPCPASAPGWGATESFFSLLTQCGVVPAVAADSAPLPAATTGAAMPFFSMPTAQVVADPAPDAPALVDGEMIAAAAVGGAIPFSNLPTPTPDVVADPAPDAVALADGEMVAAATAGMAMSAEAVSSQEGAAVSGATAGDSETPAGGAITVWPSYATGGPVAAARPVKGPIFAGYRPWVMQETETAPETSPDPTAGSLHGAGAKPTSPLGGVVVPAVNAPTPPVAVTTSDVYQQSAGQAPQETRVSPTPSTAPEAVASAAPATPTAESPSQESPTPVVEANGGMSADPGAQDGHAQQENQAAAEAVSKLVAAVTGVATDAVSGQLATASSAALSVLRGVTAATAGAASTAPVSANSAGSVDAAAGASIRAQLLAEVAAQSVGATGHEKIVLHLEPDHLGKVQIQLQANGSRLEIIVQAQNPEAEKALADGAQELMEAIVGRGEGRWQQVEVRFERSSSERDQRQQRDDTRDGGENRRGNQQGRRRGDRADR
jgi:flagellar hook-length control protein FliK